MDNNGVVIATSRNSVEKAMDATAHAEINCLRRASKFLQNWRLPNCTIYTTLEPCPICISALQAARIKRIVYGARDHRLGACGSYIDLSDNGITKHPFHSIQITGGLLEEESSL